MRFRPQQFSADIRELQLRVGEGFDDAPEERVSTDFTPIPETVAPSAVNQLRNGDLSHSVNTWNESAVVTTDKSKECAHWYSHDAPSAGQQLDASTSLADLNIDADANVATNKTLKEATHSTYNVAFCDWDRSHGVARLEGTKTLDAPLPANTATPNAGQICLGVRAALRNSSITLSDTCRFFAGIWDNTAGERDWLKASTSFTVTASVRGTPAATTERRYKVFLYTDRGYTILSDEVVVAAAPTDASYSSTVDVYLTWPLTPGILEAHVYMLDVTAGVYRLLEKTSSNSYADNGVYVNVAVAGYPAATDDRAKAYVATESGQLTDLAVDGEAASWDTIFLNIPIPAGYDMSATTDKQWLRIGLTESPTGGDHGVLLDLIHISYQPGSVYAPYPEDMNRQLAPAATPNGSSQGGVGTGGGSDPGDGGIACVAEFAPVCVFVGNSVRSIPYRKVGAGEAIFSGDRRASYVIKRMRGECASLLLVRTENGVELPCSPSHRIITGRGDANGRAAQSLRAGDYVMTYCAGRVELSKVTEIIDTGIPARVGTFRLSPGHVYVAGWRRERTIMGRIKRLARRLLGRPEEAAGILSHNRKDRNFL